MGFESLLGNDRLKDNLTASICRGRISHFYLISGPEGSGKRTLAKLLAAAILCTGADKPCHCCTACRKVMADTHPDLITVTDPEHKNVAVKLVRQIREDMFIRPNEADRKIYLFGEDMFIRPNEADRKIYLFAQDLGTEGQNALLKILEEPPSYGVFMLLTDNPEKLLPTVRSRSTELNLQSLPEQVLRSRLEKEFPDAQQETLTAAIARSGGYLGQAEALLRDGGAVSPQTEGFVNSFSQKDVMTLLQTLVPMEKWKRDLLLEELNRWLQILQQALVYRSGGSVLSLMARQLGSVRSSQELLQAVGHLQKAIEYTQGNVSPAAVCGYLEWALR